jgi:hypothetical protein
MPQPRSTGAWPSAGERRTKCTLQYATPTLDAMGGRGEPVWTDFGTWQVKVATVPVIASDTEAVILYQAEGQYRQDLVDRFKDGEGIRIVSNGLTLKVFQIENPLLVNRTLIAHCADAVNTQ